MKGSTMPADLVDQWLRSGRPARVNEKYLRPVEHPGLPGTPLSIQCGQAEAFCLSADAGSRWILKKFHSGRVPDRSYLEAIQGLVPKADGFLSGAERQVLSPRSLRDEHSCYYDPGLARWLDGTVLMPTVEGVDWASVADEAREGRVQLRRAHRLALCRSLTDLVCSMEALQIVHRDLSSSNVFVDTKLWVIRLIDFDSVYHPSLQMPQATTCGTEGYTAPFAWQNGTPDSRRTWCPHADRFALTVLNVEFLVLEEGAPLAAEGGMFHQDELRTRSGEGLALAFTTLRREYPAAASFLQAAMGSNDFEDCPSPEDWGRFLDTLPEAPLGPPRLGQLETIEPEFFVQMLAERRPAAPVWPAPSLDEMPPDRIEAPVRPVRVVSLPADPWRQ